MADKSQKSRQIRDNWVQFNTLCCGTGWDEDDLNNPQILVEDGDIILIDIPARNIAVVGDKSRRMDSNEVKSLLNDRRKRWTPPVRKHPPGILKRYTGQAVSAIKGAYLN